MKNILFTFLAIVVGFMAFGGDAHAKRYKIKKQKGGYVLLVDKKPTYINGVGGTNRLDMAEANGANAFRTWGGSVFPSK